MLVIDLPHICDDYLPSDISVAILQDIESRLRAVNSKFWIRIPNISVPVGLIQCGARSSSICCKSNHCIYSAYGAESCHRYADVNFFTNLIDAIHCVHEQSI